MGDHRRRLPVGAAVTPAVLPPVIVLRGHRNAVILANVPRNGKARAPAAKTAGVTATPARSFPPLVK